MTDTARIAILYGADGSDAPLSFPAGSIDVVLDAPLGDASLGSLSALAPDVVVLDLRGQEAAAAAAAILRVRGYWSSARIVVAGDAGNQAMAEAAFAAGTSGYVSRDASPDALLKSVLGAVRGKVSLGRTATLAILNLAGAPAPAEKAKPPG